MRRRMLGVVIAALVVAITTPVVVAGPANATAYRFWSYWHVKNGAWSFSQVGPAGYRPADGGVEGWHFAVSAGTAAAPAPRLGASSAFSSVCGTTAAQNGKKRVALVVDFGTEADAPSGDSPPKSALHGSCVVASSTASGWDVVVAAGYAIRSQDGLICGLAGYPSRGCGDVVADVTASPTPSTASTAAVGAPATTATSGGTHRSTTATHAPTTSVAANDGAVATSTSDTTASARSSGTSTTTSGADPHPHATRTPTSTVAAAPSPDASPTLVAGLPTQASTGTGGARGLVLALLALLVVGGIGTAAVRRGRRTP